MPMPMPMQWDLFCRVIDNHGDVGVCWRLAADLAARGERVRLWIDDAAALRWMAPGGCAGVQVLAWPEGDADADHTPDPGEVVVEAFGCELPTPWLRGMAAMPRAPAWVNLEYLSAEAYVERAHRLPSPQTSGPAAGLRKWFFYPGFTAQTGGLLRETDLAARQRSFDAAAWRAAHGATARPGERVVSLFCYEQPALAALLAQLAEAPTLLLAAAGDATRQVDALLGPGRRQGALRALPLPRLTQRDYDHLLWASDLNFVRGEDSFVRAQWAGQPFVWQVYPQHDGAHLAKLDAFAARFGAEAGLRDFWRRWNGAGPSAAPLPAFSAGDDPAAAGAVAWRRQCESWRDGLQSQPDLTSQLLRFVAETR